MTAPTTTYDALKNKQNELIRKALGDRIFTADYSAELPTRSPPARTPRCWSCPTATRTPAGRQRPGATWSRSVDTADVNSWSADEPTRRDVTSQTTAQETKRRVLKLYEGTNLSTVVPHATTGEVTFDQPRRPKWRTFRVFALFVDGSGADTIYIAKLLPRAMLTETGDRDQ